MPSARVGTIEHVMAALYGAGIDNALIEVDGPEVPILDGSAGPYVFLLDCAGVVEQDAHRRILEIRAPIRVSAGDAWVELRPLGGPLSRSAQPVLEMELSIDFAAAAIGRQSCALHLTPDSFRHELAQARTFALARDIEQLREAGLARGGSFDNALVVDGDAVLNPGGLRMENEFANHKTLDAVGDLVEVIDAESEGHAAFAAKLVDEDLVSGMALDVLKQQRRTAGRIRAGCPILFAFCAERVGSCANLAHPVCDFCDFELRRNLFADAFQFAVFFEGLDPVAKIVVSQDVCSRAAKAACHTPA
jgi:UDP-3-O-acyl N-acetylglucosamine deacetylase